MDSLTFANEDLNRRIATMLELIPSEDRQAAALERLCGEVGIEGAGAAQFAAGFAAVLQALGCVRVTTGPSGDSLAVRAVSPTAGWFLRSMASYLRSGRPLLTNWGRVRASEDSYTTAHALSGPLLLSWLERHRLHTDPAAVPLRRTQVSQVLIKSRFLSLGERYLVLYDGRAGDYQLPGGHQREDDSTPKETAMRELEEELPSFVFQPCRDSLIELGRTQVTQLSRTYGVVTAYDMTVFQLLTDRKRLRTSPESRWVKEADLTSSGSRVDGQPVNVTALRLIHQRLPGGIGRLPLSAGPSWAGSMSLLGRERRWELAGLVVGVAGVVASVLISIVE